MLKDQDGTEAHRNGGLTCESAVPCLVLGSTSKENLEFYQDFKVETGEYYETQQYDGEKQPQGYALWQVRSLEEANKDGAWISARLVAVSDGHLQGPGKGTEKKVHAPSLHQGCWRM